MGERLTVWLYPIIMGDVAPHYTIQKAFEKHFDCQTYDWVNLAAKKGLKTTQKNFLGMLEAAKPEYTFMQLQNPVNMDVGTVREMAKHTKILNWCGDVRTSKEWYNWFEAIGKEIHLTLFSNDTDTGIMRERGVRADYLQVGFDDGWYYPGPKTEDKSYDVVFCGNGYTSMENSALRERAVKALQKAYGDRFAVFGNGWERIGIKTEFVRNPTEAQLYRNAKVAISISNFTMKNYYSDRLLRIMACGGAVALSHEFPDMEREFQDGKHLVVFKDMDDMVSKCNELIADEATRKKIADTAHAEVYANHRWDNRCEQLVEILKKYE